MSGKRARLGGLVLTAVFAILAVLVLPVAVAQRSDDPSAVVERGRDEAANPGVRARGHRAGAATFVPPDQRIATFDNDGTLWVEKPTYIQVYFMLERIKALAPQHPEWRTTQPFQAVLDNDLAQLEQFDEKELLPARPYATSAGMPQEQYESEMRQFFATWRHPRFDHGYTELYYQPMVELLTYLRQNGFKTFIVSGRMAPEVAPRIYGIPPDQVVGSTIVRVPGGRPCTTLYASRRVKLVDDSAGKRRASRRISASGVRGRQHQRRHSDAPVHVGAPRRRVCAPGPPRRCGAGVRL